MTITLDVRPETVAKLRAAAQAQKLSLDDYLERVAESVPFVSLDQPEQPRNEKMLGIIRESRERMKDVPVSGSTEETLKMIRRARAGEMWGYEPTDADTE